MKELSIEEKAKAYDEALRVIKNLIDVGLVYEDAAIQIFPELKESEDEKIRKELLNAFQEATDSLYMVLTPKKRESFIAWLEKQGEKKTEPKFQNGQWIVWQNKCYKVNDNGCGYELIDQNGLSTSLEYGTIDESARLWDITKDVKDGDVLSYVTDEGDLWIMIYWSLYKPYEGHVHYHALLVNNNFSDKGTCCINIDNLKPATKEQCDALEKAMADAGYTFDFEKKELKKIEQKPAWSEEDEKLFKLSLENLTELKDRFGEEYGRVGGCIDWLKRLKARVQFQPQWKPTAEQMRVLEWCKPLFAEPESKGILESLIDDLKKLKD